MASSEGHRPQITIEAGVIRIPRRSALRMLGGVAAITSAGAIAGAITGNHLEHGYNDTQSERAAGFEQYLGLVRSMAGPDEQTAIVRFSSLSEQEHESCGLGDFEERIDEFKEKSSLLLEKHDSELTDVDITVELPSINTLEVEIAASQADAADFNNMNPIRTGAGGAFGGAALTVTALTIYWSTSLHLHRDNRQSQLVGT